MKKQLKKLENKNMQLTIELDKAEWEALVDESYNKNKGKYIERIVHKKSEKTICGYFKL